MSVGVLSVTLLAPLCGVVAILCTPSRATNWIRRIASTATLVSLLCAVWLCTHYDRIIGGFQYLERVAWLPHLGISYSLGIDGINLVLVLLHALCAYTGVLISYAITERVKEYYCFYLLLITGVFGVFLSLDLFFFYFFYEMAVIPMFPLIGIWGSHATPFSKEYATMKLTLYLTAGAVVALIGLLALYHFTGLRTFHLSTLHEYLIHHPLPVATQRWVFACLLVGFGVIAPMWPLHSWSPIGHAAAPSAVSMLHAGVLMKLGSYAIIRLGLTLLPEGAKFWLPMVATLCLFNILYGGWVAMAQKDAKFIIGYSSSSHMGYVLLGIATLTPLGLDGAVLLMFAHGLMTALGFALVGHIYDQTHTRLIHEWGGLGQQVPFVATAFVFMTMASSGLPGFANFVAEVLIFLGAWQQYKLQTMLAVFGVVITAVYMLRMVRTACFGPLNLTWTHLVDARTWLQRWPYLLLISTLLLFGFWPGFLVSTIDRAARPLIAHVTGDDSSSRMVTFEPQDSERSTLNSDL